MPQESAMTHSNWLPNDNLGLAHAQAFRHFLVQKSSSGAIGLDPFSVNYKLRDGAFAGFLDNFLGSSGYCLDVDFLVGNIVLGEEALGLAAIRTPEGGIDSYFHIFLDYDKNGVHRAQARKTKAAGNWRRLRVNTGGDQSPGEAGLTRLLRRVTRIPRAEFN
jgi:hypothetical protein